jgi:hypothetical protein
VAVGDAAVLVDDAVAVAVGVAVPVGGSGVLVAVGTAVLVGVAVAGGDVTVNVVLAVSPVALSAHVMAAAVPGAMPSGTVSGNEKAPSPTMNDPIETPPNWTARRPGVNPLPLTVTIDPGGPLVGRSATCGVAVSAGVAVTVR